MDKQTVMAKFPVARHYGYMSRKWYEIHADGSMYPCPHMLGEGATIEEAWANAAKNVLFWHPELAQA